MKRAVLSVLGVALLGGILLWGKSTDINGNRLCPAAMNGIVEEIVPTTYNNGSTQFEYNVLTLAGFCDSEIEIEANQTIYHALTDWVDSECSWLERASITLMDNSQHYVTIKQSCESFGNRYDILNLYVTIDTETGRTPDWESLIGGEDAIVEILSKEFPEMANSELDNILQAALMTNKEYIEYTKIENAFSALLFKPSFYIEGEKIFLKYNSIEADDIILGNLRQG